MIESDNKQGTNRSIPLLPGRVFMILPRELKAMIFMVASPCHNENVFGKARRAGPVRPKTNP
eukprot:scaffold18109_cov54-Attheya_sp.AAC.3